MPDPGEMGWQSFLIPVLGSLAVASLSFYLGASGFSYLWIGLIVLFNLAKSYMWRQREKRLLSLRATATKEREVILAQLQDLPAWVQFPDTERVEWINKVILQLWPYIGEYAKVFMQEFVEPQVRAQMPAMFKNFKFTKMDMGDIPCRVGGIKVYTHNVGRDRIIVDMDVAYAGDSDFSVSVCGFTGGLNQLVFSGKLRAVLKPLLPYPPMVGGVSGSFLEMPKIDFNLTGMGEMVELPGLLNAIRSVVNSQVSALCVLPNEIVMPLAPNVDVTKLFFPEPDGVVRLKVIEARNLENRDISFIKKGKSDPYAEIQVGSQFMKTRTIDNDLNPVWNEHFEAIVDQANGQKLRLELFDEDQGQDEELGRLSLDLDAIRKKGTIENWFPLEGCKHGDLHLKATWLDLSTDMRLLEKLDWENEWLKADKPIHPALLLVFVDNVSELPYPKAKLEPSPFIEVRLGKEVQKTPVKVKTVNPLFQSRFSFFVRHPEGQELRFEAFDDGTKRSLGTLALPLSHLMKEPKAEYAQQTFSLSLGVHQSPIVLTVKLRTLARSMHVTASESLGGTLDTETLQRYATGAHIERAEKLENGQNGHGIENGHIEIEAPSDASPSKLTHRDSSLSVQSATLSPSKDSTLKRLLKSRHEKSKERRRDATRGELRVGVRYAEATCKLVVVVHAARSLLAVDSAGSADPYVTVKLASLDGSKATKKKTGIARATLEPVFDNHLEFDVHSSDLLNHKLVFLVKDATNYGVFSSSPILGQLELRLDALGDLREQRTKWLVLDAEKR